MTDFLKIAKSIVVHFAHICAYGVETVKKEIEECKEEIDKLEQDWKCLRKEIQNFKSPAAMMQGDNDQTRFYTGLPSVAVFASLSNLSSGLIFSWPNWM